MSLALPLTHPEQPQRVLLARGFVLESRAVVRLQELGIRDIWVDYPGLESINEYINPLVFETRAALTQRVNVMLRQFEHDRHAKIGIAEYRAVLQDLVNLLTQDPVAAVYLDDLQQHDNPLLRHSSNTCFLSLLLGLKLKAYLVQQRPRLNADDATRITSLGLGAMLHDIGMRELDAAVRQRWEETRCEHDPAWRAHVELGYRLVTGRVDPPAAAIVLHHHQYFDGSGFPTRFNPYEGRPQGMQGQRIHVFARIVTLADHFDELQYSGHDGGRVPTVKVLRRIVATAMVRRFDPEILRGLLGIVPAYAPGSLVTLSDGRRGFVMDWKRNAPCRPQVAFVPQFVGRGEEPAAEGESDFVAAGVAVAPKAASAAGGSATRPAAGRAVTGSADGAAGEKKAAAAAAVPTVDLARRADLHIVEIDGVDVSEDEFTLPGELKG